MEAAGVATPSHLGSNSVRQERVEVQGWGNVGLGGSEEEPKPCFQNGWLSQSKGRRWAKQVCLVLGDDRGAVTDKELIQDGGLITPRAVMGHWL